MKTYIQKTLITLSLATSVSFAQEANMDSHEEAISLFDGETLSGWHTSKADEKFWSVKDGLITGGDLENNVPSNVWLVSDKSYENFELTFEIKFTDGEKSDLLKNSGIQIRSLVMGNRVIGYQIDAGPSQPKREINGGLGYWGNIWDEHRRGALVTAENQDLLKESVKNWDWNSYKVIANGTNIKTWINGILAHEYTEKNDKIAADGIIALQAHKGGKFLVQFKDIKIKELAPTENSTKWTDEGVIKGKPKKRKPVTKQKK